MHDINDILKAVRNYTAYRITRIFSSPDAQRRAALANLRRGVGYAPGAVPELWGEFLADWERFFKDDDSTPYVEYERVRAEWAVYTALTLFAMHQQGSESPVHTDGQCSPGNPQRGAPEDPPRGFGTAVGRLVKNQDDIERVLHRFNPAATAVDMAEAAHHLRGLIRILRSESIGLDYAELAADLYQLSTESADKVRLKWGRDFYREVYKANKTTEEASSNE